MGAKNANEITIGSCDIYIDSQFVGYSGDEVVIAISRDIASFFAGLPKVKIVSVVTQEEASVTFEFAQVNAVNLSYAVGKNGNVDPITVAGNDIVEGGGDTSLGVAHLLEIVHTFPDDREFRFILWKGMPEPTFELAFAAGKFIGIKSKWAGNEDSTRAAGKRVWRAQIEKLVKS